jgi:hypothetical protein
MPHTATKTIHRFVPTIIPIAINGSISVPREQYYYIEIFRGLPYYGVKASAPLHRFDFKNTG